MTELGRVPWNLNFSGTQKVCVTQKYFGTRVLNDGTQFAGTQEVNWNSSSE